VCDNSNISDFLHKKWVIGVQMYGKTLNLQNKSRVLCYLPGVTGGSVCLPGG
jgi:hypothetical protein